MEFLFDLGSEYIPVGTYLFLDLFGNTEYDKTITRNRVMQFTTIEAGETQSVSLLCLIEETGEYLNGVSAFLVDVVTRVTANKTFQGSLDEEEICGSLLFLEMERGCCIASTGTGYEYLTFVL